MNQIGLEQQSVANVHLHTNHYPIKRNIIMKHTEMKDLTPIKSNHKEVVAKGLKKSPIG
jgi:hypothetical protein